MKKTIVVLATAVLALGACNKPSDPQPVPTKPTTPVVVTPSAVLVTTPPAVETTAPTQGGDSDNPPVKSDEPTTSVAPSSEAAAPPATQFAQRWGAKYPNVPEYAILKAANSVCYVINAAGADWAKNEEAVASVEAAVSVMGINKSDGVEFAQDAAQNYCSSVSNPT